MSQALEFVVPNGFQWADVRCRRRMSRKTARQRCSDPSRRRGHGRRRHRQDHDRPPARDPARRPVRRGRRLPPAGQHRQDVGRAPRSTDDDRWPWLDAIGGWAHGRAGLGGVVSCSALKRSYRDRLRSEAPGVVFVHLTGDRALIEDRMSHRQGTSCPPRCWTRSSPRSSRSAADEAGVAVDVSGSPEEITERAVEALAALPAGLPVTAPHTPQYHPQQPPSPSPYLQGTHPRDQSQCRDAGSGRRRADHLGRPRPAGHRRPGGHRRHRPAHHQVQAPRLPVADHRLPGARRVRRGAARQGHRQLHHRARYHRGRRGRADRARRDPRQAARRLRAAPTRSSTRSSRRRAGAPCPGRWC